MDIILSFGGGKFREMKCFMSLFRMESYMTLILKFFAVAILVMSVCILDKVKSAGLLPEPCDSSVPELIPVSIALSD